MFFADNFGKPIKDIMACVRSSLPTEDRVVTSSSVIGSVYCLVDANCELG